MKYIYNSILLVEKVQYIIPSISRMAKNILRHVCSDYLLSIFVRWAIVSLGQCFRKLHKSPNFRANLFMYQVWQKLDWATFWAIFLQTHLVTLIWPHILNYVLKPFQSFPIAIVTISFRCFKCNSAVEPSPRRRHWLNFFKKTVSWSDFKGSEIGKDDFPRFWWPGAWH
jgi:hypothetical protein